MVAALRRDRFGCFGFHGSCRNLPDTQSYPLAPPTARSSRTRVGRPPNARRAASSGPEIRVESEPAFLGADKETGAA